MPACRTHNKDTFSISNIRKCEEYVFGMQKRLDKAIADNDRDKIRTIINILLRRSHAVKVLAVWRITYRNAGKNTAGIDGICIPKGTREETDKIRFELLNLINIAETPKPIKRAYIPKSNGKKRPLGIPTIQDRITQEIIRIALEPISEYHAHDNSFGFRSKRSCQDAHAALFIYLASSNRKRYILEGDLTNCFDNISHQHIINMLRHWKTPKYVTRIIAKTLKSGVLDKGQITPNEEGTPQGGVISPMLCNVALTAFDWTVSELFGKRNRYNKASPMIRYADDFVILCHSKTEAKQMKEWVSKYLSNKIGLTLSDEKTKIVHIKKGFDFLGFNFRKYPKKHNPKDINDYKLLIKPQEEKVINFLRSCKEVIKNNKQSTQEGLIRLLNPKIRGWGNYYKHVVSKRIFSKVDYHIWNKLYFWSKRRHSNKNKKWIINQYFKRTENGKTKYFRIEDLALHRLSEIPILRHIKVKNGKRIYNSADKSYWEKRDKMLMYQRLYRKHHSVFKKQKGNCPNCNLPLCSEDTIHLHHVIPKHLGGSDRYSNLSLLHAECHRELHSKYGAVL